MNKVFLGGTVKDLEYLNLGERQTPLLKFSIEVIERGMQSGETKEKRLYHQVQAGNATADALNGTIQNEQYVFVSGRLSKSSYEKDGNTVWKTEVTADTVDIPIPSDPVASVEETDDLPF